MSFILDALRKAERERSLGKPPDLRAMTGAAAPIPAYGSNRSPILRLAVLVVLIVICVAPLAILHYRHTAARTTLPAAAVAAPVIANTEAVANIATPLPAPDEGFARTDSPLGGGTTDADNPSITSLDDLSGDSTVDDEETPSTETPPAQTDDSALAETVITPTPAKSRSARASVPVPAVVAPAPEPVDDNTAPGAAEPSRATTPTAETPAPTTPSSPAPADATTSVEQVTLAPAPTPTVPLLKDMPADYRTAFPTLTVNVHSYDSQSQKRFVMINDHNYREGDTLPEGPHIVSIVSNGIIFDYHGQQVLFTIGGH